MTVSINPDSITTAAGVIAALIQAANIDMSKLMAGDKSEWKRLGLAIVFAAWGYATNRGRGKVTPEVQALMDQVAELKAVQAKKAEPSA